RYLVYCGFLLRAHRNGVDHADFLGRLIAAYSADDRGETSRPLFASDLHFAHQTAKLILHWHPLGVAKSSWAKRQRAKQRPLESGRSPRPRVRLFTFHRWNAALGLLALKCANEINKRRRDDHDPSSSSSNLTQELHHHD